MKFVAAVLLACVAFARACSKEGLVELVASDHSHVETLVRPTYLSAQQKQIFRPSSPKAIWMQMIFEEVKLPLGAQIVVRGIKDGFEQFLNWESLAQWNYRSAYFNGDAIEVSVLNGTASRNPTVGVVGMVVGEDPPADPIQDKTLCGPTDRRQRNRERPKDARYQFGGSVCSSWLIADEFGCFLTAGHCGSSGTMAFNVPDSTSNGGMQHPAPEFQFSTDSASNQGVNGGVGNDWRYIGVFANSNTGLSPRQTQGVTGYQLSTDTSRPATGTTWQHFGHGSASGSNNLVSKGSRGPYAGGSGNRATYQIDTTGGDSGSAFSQPGTCGDAQDGCATVIHTHGGCQSNGSGANQGTFIATHSNLQNALNNPRGICASGY